MTTSDPLQSKIEAFASRLAEEFGQLDPTVEKGDEPSKGYRRESLLRLAAGHLSETREFDCLWKRRRNLPTMRSHQAAT